MLESFNVWFSHWQWSIALILSLVGLGLGMAALALALTMKDGGGGGDGRWRKRPKPPKPGKGFRVGISKDFYHFMVLQKRDDPWYKQAMDGWRNLRPKG